MSDLSLYLLTEAAERTGLTVEAIRQRIKRGRLEAVKGNDGLLRVRLTSADMETFNRSMTSHKTPTMTGQATEDDRLANALQAAAAAQGEAAALREAIGRERERADKAEARADQTEAERDATRAEAVRAQVAAASAEGEAKGLRLALEEARRPFWRRWIG